MKTRRSLESIRPILQKIKTYLLDNYGHILEGVILYGSFAKGKATVDSDIDLAVILKGEIDKSKERDRIMDLVNEILLDTGELISVRFLSKKEIEGSIWPFFYNVEKEGIRL